MRLLKWIPVGMAIAITAGLAFGQGLPPPSSGSSSPWTTGAGGTAVLQNGANIDTPGHADGCVTFFDNQDGAHVCWGGGQGSMDAAGQSNIGGVTLVNGTVVAGGSEWTLSSTYLNAVASAVTVGGHKIGAQPLTLLSVTYYVSGAASGAGNTVFRATDGTNTCDFTSSCTTNDNTTGVKRVDGGGTAGTGCSFAASASITLSIQSTTCATTKPTIKNIDWVGTGA